MSEREEKRYEFDQEHCRRLLTGLPGVFAAGVRFEEEQLVEIHVLASAARSAKQIARDIQSTIFAVYDEQVDHRIISIAQLPENPLLDVQQALRAQNACGHDVRPLFAGMDASSKDGAYEISVHLTYGDRLFTGKARCRDTHTQRRRAWATAALDAVHKMLGRECFDLLEVRHVTAGDVEITVTVIEYMDECTSAPVTLTGAAAERDGEAEGVVRSTLDAINRCLGKICRLNLTLE